MMEITIPTKLSEIPLYQMQEYESLKMDAEERALNAVAIFCNISLSEVSKLPLKILNHALDLITKCLDEKPRFQHRFTYEGVEYGFIPNLDEISTGEFVDLDSYQKEGMALWKMMSVLYRPIVTQGQNNRYLIEPYQGKLNESFKQMPSDIAFGSLVFFWSLGNDLMSYILKFSETQREKLMNTSSTKNGGGWDSYISSLTEMSQNLTQLANSPCTPIRCGRLTRATWQLWKDKLLINQNDE
jgi:hypothetical protein